MRGIRSPSRGRWRRSVRRWISRPIRSGEAFRSGKPFLGVCVALQVIFEGSQESPGVEGLGLLPGEVVRFGGNGLKVPHIGWNELSVARAHPILDGLDGEAFYFVHSYYPVPE